MKIGYTSMNHMKLIKTVLQLLWYQSACTTRYLSAVNPVIGKTSEARLEFDRLSSGKDLIGYASWH